VGNDVILVRIKSRLFKVIIKILILPSIEKQIMRGIRAKADNN